MLKKIVIALFCLLPIALFAQEMKFGHVNSQEIMTQMPQTQAAQTKLETMAKQYETELTKASEEYEKQVSEFLALGDASDGIKKIKQDEIAKLEQRITLVRQTASEQLQKEQEKLLAPIVDEVKKAIDAVGEENGFLYIYDLSVPAIVYKSSKSIDITPMLKKKLNIK